MAESTDSVDSRGHQQDVRACLRGEDLPRQVLDRLLEGCQVIGHDFRYLYVNEAAAAHGRTSREHLLGRTMMEAFPGIETTPMFAVLRRCLDERTPDQMENEFSFADGTRRWFELRFEPVPSGVVILSIDITERRRAQAREAHLGLVLRAIRNVNQLIVQEKDRPTLLQRTCDLLTEARGYRTAWIGLGDTAPGLRLAAESGIGADSAPLREQLERGDPPDCCQLALARHEVVVMHDPATRCTSCALSVSCRDTGGLAASLRHAGRNLGVLVVALPADAADDPEEQALFREVAGDLGFALHGLDAVEEQHRTRQALHRSEEQIRALVDAAPDGIFVQSGGRVLYANPAMVKLLGAGCADDLLGVQFTDRISPEYREAVRDRIRRQRETGLPAPPMDQVYVRVDGTRVAVETSAVPIRFQGHDAHLVFVRDTTLRRKAEAEREHLRAQLQQTQKIESIGRLAGGIAHDFNNLLSVILSYARFCADALRESDPMQADILEILEASRRAAGLTRQLLAFSRKQVLELVVLDLGAVITGIEGMLRRLLGEDVVIEVRIAADLGRVMADPGQIEQVLVNLSVNARDAMPLGGKLTIEASNVVLEDDAAAKPGRHVRIEVADTGCGMDAATLEHIFEPFFTTKEKGKGTGLGLSTVYGIVTQSGGDVRVHSAPGRGTTFRVYLPRVDAPAAEAPRKAAPVKAAGHETVLLVEDEGSVRKLIERMLRGAGYRVLSAASGGDALVLCEKYGETVDLLVTDVVMPHMSGRELATRLQKLRPELKVLFMSGYTDDAILHHGVLEPGVHFIGKPFASDELTRKVRKTLDEA